MLKSDRRNIGIKQRLVPRRRHFLRLWKIDPQLNRLKCAALFRPLGFVQFLVHDARGGRHPLDVSWADHAGVACRIPVSHRAVIHDGDRLKSAMGMLADSSRVVGRCKMLRASVVQHEKRVDGSIQIVARKKVAHGKAVADHMRRSGMIDTQNFLRRRYVRCHEVLLADGFTVRFSRPRLGQSTNDRLL